MLMSILSSAFPGNRDKDDDMVMVCRDSSDSLRAKVFRLYYVCNESVVREDYMDNASQMDSIRKYLASSPRIDSIAIFSSSSPEGSFRRNSYLSRIRAEAARDFMISNAGHDIRGASVSLHPVDENWEGLREAVIKSYHRHDLDRVVRILDDTSVGVDTRKWRLMQLDGGYTWDYLKRNLMPQLRYTTLICVWEKPAIQEIPEISGGGIIIQMQNSLTKA